MRSPSDSRLRSRLCSRLLQPKNSQLALCLTWLTSISLLIVPLFTFSIIAQITITTHHPSRISRNLSRVVIGHEGIASHATTKLWLIARALAARLEQLVNVVIRTKQLHFMASNRQIGANHLDLLCTPVERVDQLGVRSLREKTTKKLQEIL